MFIYVVFLPPLDSGRCLWALAVGRGSLRGYHRQSAEAELIKAYQTMVLTRTLDTKMVALQRQGRIGFYLPSYEIHFYQFMDQTITHLPHSVVHSFHKPH